jgi:catalase
LWEAIDGGDFPEWEFGVQIVEEKDEHKFDFDLLDPTKIIPEEMVPVRRIGKLTLNRNPDNFFAETEQVAFHPGHVVPGIDFTNDPLLQGRLFSYTDTQLLRLGGPNFHEIPINRPIAPLHNHQRDGHMRQTIDRGRVSYEPNTLGNGDPAQAKVREGGFASFSERLDGFKVRGRSESFFDHFSQAAMFFHSQSPTEQGHLISALRFELGKVATPAIRERMVYLLSQVDGGLAGEVAAGLGLAVPTKIDGPMNRSIPADGNPKDFQPKRFGGKPFISAALSMADTVKNTARTRKVAALAADGCDDNDLAVMRKALMGAGAQLKIVAPHGGSITSAGGKAIPVDFSLLTVASVLFDAVYLPGGEANSASLLKEPKFIEFVEEAYKHCKAIAATGAGVDFLMKTRAGARPKDGKAPAKGIVNVHGVIAGPAATQKLAAEFIAAIAQHRAWDREEIVMPVK